LDHTPTHRKYKNIPAFTQQEHDTYLYWVPKILKKILIYLTKKVFLNAGGKEGGGFSKIVKIFFEAIHPIVKRVSKIAKSDY